MSDATQSEAFRSAGRESSADTFGMWIFLGSEAMLFGGLLLVYLTARLAYPEAFGNASRQLSLPLGTLNTAILLTSSLTMALAHGYTTLGRWRAAVWSLAATAVLGAAFLGVKALEYWHEFEAGVAPVFGTPFHYFGPDPAHAELFFNLYFVTTSLHAAHLAGGIAVVTVLIGLWRSADGPRRLRRVNASGLYWHFVDIVWVFLFPILYLIDR